MRSPSTSSDSGGAGSSGSSDSEAADPHQAAIKRRRGRAAADAQRPVGDAGLVVHYVDERAGGADAAGGAAAAAKGDAPRAGSARRGGAARDGTPEEGGAGGDEWAGESEEMRRLLRQPRYYDDDFEAAAQRCFRCGGSGHRERECAAAPRERPCFLCGLFGHVSRDCPNGLCFNCSAPGHQSRECPEPRGAGAAKARCLRCGSRSHVAPACERDYDSEDLAAVTCYVCGVAGHLCCAPPPEHVPEPSCYRCGGGGHFGYECNARFAAPQQGQGGGLAECFRCGGRGHFARECPAALSRAGLPTAGMGFGGMGGGGGGGGQGGREVSWQPNAPRSAGPGDAKRSRQSWEDEEEKARRRKQQRQSAGAATYRRFDAEDI